MVGPRGSLEAASPSANPPAHACQSTRDSSKRRGAMATSASPKLPGPTSAFSHGSLKVEVHWRTRYEMNADGGLCLRGRLYANQSR